MNAESNISNFLADFKLFGNNIAVIYCGTGFSYNYILERITFWRDKLNYIQAGTIVGIEGDFSPESIAILFVLLEQNAIIVPLDINYKNKNESKYDIAQLEILIIINSETNIEIINRDNKYYQNELYKLLISKNVPGLVLFT
ncbi:MAG: hypothetical protein GW876_00710, partial [Bacteroidetes bacterium]|nr:hypothetical protein [Bacteroidota bacterium]